MDRLKRSNETGLGRHSQESLKQVSGESPGEIGLGIVCCLGKRMELRLELAPSLVEIAKELFRFFKGRGGLISMSLFEFPKDVVIEKGEASREVWIDLRVEA
jgi:hypothetical protein